MLQCVTVSATSEGGQEFLGMFGEEWLQTVPVVWYTLIWYTLHTVHDLLTNKACRVCAYAYLESVTSNQKPDSIGLGEITPRTIVRNFIPIGFETTESWAFFKSVEIRSEREQPSLKIMHWLLEGLNQISHNLPYWIQTFTMCCRQHK